jgi:signal transduction histidine kinase
MARTSLQEARVAKLTGLPRATIHQLRTPLTSIRGYAQLLLRGARSPEQQQRAHETILRESDRLARMLDCLARAAEARLGDAEGRPTSLELGDLARMATEQARRRWPERRFELQAGEPLRVLADPQQLEAAVGYLLENAVAFSEPDSPIVTTVRRRAQDAHLTVCDEGIGIPPDELERIFECFVRGSNAGQAGPSQSLGLGLGLYLARAAVERAGGRLWAENNPAPGATVHLSLPLAD